MKGLLMYAEELPDRYYTQANQVKRLSTVLRELAKETALTKAFKHREVSVLLQEIVGEEIYRHTRVTGLRKGCLTVEVDSSALLHHLTIYCKENILMELQKKYKNTFIASIRFKQSMGVN